MNFQKLLIYILFVGTVVAGCSEDEEVALNIKADAYIRAMYINDTVRYAPVLLAESSTSVSGLNVVDNKEIKYPLETYWDRQNSYRWVPREADFKTSFPKTMQFTFSTSSSEKRRGQQEKEKDTKAIKITANVSLAQVPKPFAVKNLAYDKEKKEFTVSWGISNADTYLITISEKLDEKPIFQSFSLVSPEAGGETKEIGVQFDLKTLKWFSTPKKGEKYLLTVHAFKIADESTNDIAGEFIATKEFVFGE